MSVGLGPEISTSNYHITDQKKSKSELSKALCRGDFDRIQCLKSEHKCEFTLEESWQIKVFENIDFIDDEFLSLEQITKNLVYRTANNLNNIALVARLNSLGMKTREGIIRRPSIVSQTMDISTIHRVILVTLNKFRKEGLFLTKKEFEHQKKSHSWVEKCRFNRVLGSIYISELIEQLKLKHIKVPEKKAVIRSTDLVAITFCVRQDDKMMDIYSDEVSVYAKKIQSVERLLSRNEIFEILTIIKAANYSDLNLDNFIVSNDGVYIIDTEFKSFSYRIQWGK